MEPRVERLACTTAILLAVAWAVIGTAAVCVDFQRHSEATALVLVEGVAGLGLQPVGLEVPVNQGLSVDVLGLFPGIWALGQALLVLPYRYLDPWLGMRLGLIAGALFSAAASLLVFRYARKSLAGPGTALLAQGLFLALPAQWALSVFWQQNPNSLLLFGALLALAAGRFGGFLALGLLQASLHPLAAPVMLAVSWAALRAPALGFRPLVPGVHLPADVARRRFRITAAVLGGVFALLLAALAWRALSSGTGGSLAWYFVARKLEFGSGEQLRNLPTLLLYLLPLGFLPLLDVALLPALLPLLAYVGLGSQGLVSAVSSLVLGVVFLAYLHRVSSFGPRVQAAILAGGIAAAVALQVFVPFRVLFPLGDGPAGGPLSAETWQVPPREAAVDALVRGTISAGAGACAADFSRMPLLMEFCSSVAPLTYPGRKGHRGLVDFLERTDGGRLDAGGWQYLLVDRDLLAEDAALPDFLARLEGGGRYQVAARRQGVTLYRAAPGP